MKLVVKFKDGLVSTTDLEGSMFSGNANLFELLRKGKEMNSSVRLEVEDKVIEKTFNDVYSFEIVMD